MDEWDAETEPGESDSHLKDSVEGLRQMAFGIVGRLAGAERVGDDVNLDKPAVSPEVDAAIERLGVALGSVLEEAGRALKQQSSRDHGAPSDDQASSEPLFSQGAAALAGGIQALAREIQSHLSNDGEE